MCDYPFWQKLVAARDIFHKKADSITSISFKTCLEVLMKLCDDLNTDYELDDTLSVILYEQLRLGSTKQGTQVFCFVHLWLDRLCFIEWSLLRNHKKHFFPQQQKWPKSTFTTAITYTLETNCCVKTSTSLLLHRLHLLSDREIWKQDLFSKSNVVLDL